MSKDVKVPTKINFGCGCVATRRDGKGIFWSLEHCDPNQHPERNKLIEALRELREYVRGRWEVAGRANAAYTADMLSVIGENIDFILKEHG